MRDGSEPEQRLIGHGAGAFVTLSAIDTLESDWRRRRRVGHAAQPRRKPRLLVLVAVIAAAAVGVWAIVSGVGEQAPPTRSGQAARPSKV
jgi:hypothetical protein